MVVEGGIKMGIFGPPNIKKLADKKNIKGLIKALQYKDSNDIRIGEASSRRDWGKN